MDSFVTAGMKVSFFGCFAQWAVEAERIVIVLEGRMVDPPAAFLAETGSVLVGGCTAQMIDSFECLQRLESWFRERFLPALLVASIERLCVRTCGVANSTGRPDQGQPFRATSAACKRALGTNGMAVCSESALSQFASKGLDQKSDGAFASRWAAVAAAEALLSASWWMGIRVPAARASGTRHGSGHVERVVPCVVAW